MRGDPEVLGRLTGWILMLFVALVADVAWEVRKWLKK
jgi:hypothetical protein